MSEIVNNSISISFYGLSEVYNHYSLSSQILVKIIKITNLYIERKGLKLKMNQSKINYTFKKYTSIRPNSVFMLNV